MLSSVLNSKKSIAVNIQIVRIFTAMRELILTNNQVLLELNKMKSMVEGQDDRIDMIYNYLQEFIKQKNTTRKTIGFKPQ